MAFYHAILKYFITRRLDHLRTVLADPVGAQDRILRQLIDDHAASAFGRHHGLKPGMDVDAFRRAVPLHDYTALKPWIDRLIAGEPHVLTTEEIRWFAKSSGTTSARSKYIPVTRSALDDCHFAGGKDLMALYLDRFPDSRLVDGKSLVLGGSQQPESVAGRFYVGDLSAVLIENLPFWAQMVRTPDRRTALIPDWEQKLEEMVRKTVDENVTSLAGVPSWNLLFVQRLLEYTGARTVREVWPNLELFIHGGVSMDGYREPFRDLIGSPDMRFLETYNASEGFFGMQDDIDRPDMLLMPDYGIFFEFIEDGHWSDADPPTCTLADVQTDVAYELVITTNAGLWRYRIGDTVRFTDLHPHRFVLTGRTSYHINICGEEVVEDNVNAALKQACAATGAVLGEYTGAPRRPTGAAPGVHEYIIEFGSPPGDLDRFARIFDQALRDANSDYDAKRSADLLLDRPVIHVAPENTFYAWMKQRGKLGGQNKVPRLSNDRRHLDDLFDLMRS